jgi:hypothetical protein
LADKDNQADEGGGDAGDEDSGGGDIETAVNAGLNFVVKAVEKLFDGTVEKLGDKDGADAADQETPFDGAALEDDSGSEDQGGEEEVDREAGMSANSQLQTPEGVAELVTPGAAGFAGRGRRIGRR